MLTLAALALMASFGPLSIDVYLPALPEIGADLSAVDSLVQMTLSAVVVGLALGQLVIGPLSDRYGRRVTLLTGISLFIVTSIICAFAPSIGTLIAARFLQGFSAAAGQVVGRAIVRDIFEFHEIARAFSLLMLITVAAPIFAPLLGGQLVRFMPWRGIFLVLAGIGIALALIAALMLPESHPQRLRSRGGVAVIWSGFTSVFRDQVFNGAVAVHGTIFASIFVYISIIPFVLQQQYGLSPTAFSVMFSAGGLGLIIGNRISALLLRTLMPVQILMFGLFAIAVGTAGIIIGAQAHLSLWGLMVPMFGVLISLGMLVPNTTTIAMIRHPTHAGTASALLGTFQFAFAAVGGLLASLGGTSAAAMGAVMAILVVTAHGVYWTVLHPVRQQANQEF